MNLKVLPQIAYYALMHNPGHRDSFWKRLAGIVRKRYRNN